MVSISHKFVLAAFLATCLIYLIYYNCAEDASNLHDVVMSFKGLAKVDHEKSERQESQRWKEDKVQPEEKEEVAIATEKNEEYPHPDLYDRDLTLINITNFKFVINNDICNVQRVALVTIIHTAVDNHEARSMIRSVINNSHATTKHYNLIMEITMNKTYSTSMSSSIKY